MNYLIDTENADVNTLLKWLKVQLGPQWNNNCKEKMHPLKRALYASKDPSVNQDIVRALSFSKIMRELSNFPTRRSDGKVITDDVFFNQLIKRSKQSIAEFCATEIEATVAWSYVNILKQPIISLKAGKSATPDFEISIGGLPAYIECKARNIITPQFILIDDMRSEIISLVSSLLDHSTTNYGIYISTKQIPNKTVIPNLVRSIEALLLKGEAFSCSIGSFEVETTILLPNDKDIVTTAFEPFGPEEHVPEPIRNFMINCGVGNQTTYVGICHKCHKENRNGLIYYRNPKVVVVHFEITPDHVNAIYDLINDARKQLTQNSPAVIYLYTPDFYGLNQFFNLGQSIAQALKSAPLVSGVVIWHQIIQKKNINPNDSNQTLWWQLFCIRNNNAQNPLPSSFELNYLPRGNGFQVLNRT